MTTHVVTLAVLASVALAAGPLHSQDAAPVRIPTTPFRVTPYAGYMVFGNYLQGPLGIGLSNESAPVYGAELGLNVTDNVALVGNVAYSKSSWQVRAPIIGGLSLGDASILMYDAGVQLRAALNGRYARLTPIVHVGVGAIRHTVDNLPVITPKTTNLAFNAGLGVDYQLSRSLGVRMMAKDYIGRVDFGQVVGYEGLEGRRAHNVALSVGMNLGF